GRKLFHSRRGRGNDSGEPGFGEQPPALYRTQTGTGCMTDLIATLARETRQHPQRVVLVDARASLTLGELWQRVSMLGEDFRRAGLQPGERLVLIGPNSTAWVQVWLAALAVGAVVVPLNPELRAADQAALVAHAEADFVFI